MNIGNAIVSYVVDTGDIIPFLEVDPQSPVLFAGEDKLAWEYLLKYFNTHKLPATEEVFRSSFPEETYRFGEIYTPSELLELASEKQRAYNLSNHLTTVIDLHDQGKLDEAESAAAAFKVKASTDSQLFRVLRRSELEKLPDPVPVIKGLIDQGTVTMLIGQYSVYKSFMALDWGCCVASGKNWKGKPVTRGKVLYIAAEGGFGQKFRVAAWEQHNNRMVGDDDFHMIPQPVQLRNNEHTGWLSDLIAKEEYDLVIVDTLARSSIGADENSAKDMGLVIDNIYKLRDAAGEGRTSFVIIHHMGKSESAGSRGSTAVPGNIDIEYRMSRTDSTVELKCSKYKDGPDDLKMSFEALKVGNSLVLEEYLPDVVKAMELKQAISDYMEIAREASVRDIRTNVKGDDNKIGQAVKEMKLEGFLSEEGRKTVFVKSYEPPF